MKTTELEQEILELKAQSAAHDLQLTIIARGILSISQELNKLNIAHLSIISELKNNTSRELH